MSLRPVAGETVLLVYRECPCGNWLATGEGDVAPRCARCGGCYLPGGLPLGAGWRERRRRDGRGFIAEFGGEAELRESRREVGVPVADRPAYFDRGPLREESLRIIGEEMTPCGSCGVVHWPDSECRPRGFQP